MTSIVRIDAEPAKTKMKVVEIPQVLPLVLPLLLPQYVDATSTSSLPHSYHSLGHCLRSNIFPGAPLPWKSLTKDSYIHHPLPNWPPDPHLWYGHKTDEIVQWTERNIVNQKLNKILTEMEKKGHRKMRSCFLP